MHPTHPTHPSAATPAAEPRHAGRTATSLPLRELTRAAACGLALTIWMPSSASAQQIAQRASGAPAPAAVEPPRAAAPTTRPRPAYQSLRFMERWPERDRLADHDALDALKHVALSPGGAVYATVSGQLRYRGEQVHNYQLVGGTARDDAFGLTRTLLGVDLHAGEHVRLFAEGRDVRAQGRDLPGGARSQDEDRLDVQNLFGEVSHAYRGWTAAARVGRQEISVGRERLLGVSDYSNARRAHDGARLLVSGHDLSLDAFMTQPVVVRQHESNIRDSVSRVVGLALGGTRVPVMGAAWQLYALQLDQIVANFAGLSGTQQRTTVGARLTGSALAPWLAYEVEGGTQRGRLADQRIAAWFVASELTATAAKLPAKPAFSVGADQASGDRDAADGTTNTFNHLYPTAHSHVGLVDILGRQNVRELRAATTATVGDLQTRLSLHQFTRASLADGAYGTSGTSFRAASGSTERALGREVDLTGTYALGRHTRVLVGYGHFAPGAFLRETAGGARPVDWGFGSVVFTF